MMNSINEFILLGDDLLSPLPGENPAGSYLLYDQTYDSIKEAMREDDPDLSRGVWEHDLKKADWPEVERLCMQALGERTRDLQIAGWLMQASTRRHGFAGFKESFQLLVEYCERFWEWIHPADDEYRQATFEWMDRRMPEALGRVPLVQPAPGERVFAFADVEALRAREMSGETDEDEDDVLTRADLERQIEASPTEIFKAATLNLEEALQATRRLQAMLDEKMGAQAPTLRHIEEAGETLRDFNQEIWRQREPEVEAPSFEDEEATTELTAVEGGVAEVPLPTGQIRNRDDAYRQLLAAAEFLQKTEPHSPTPYLVRRAVSWGDMSLEELLTELVGDTGGLPELYRLLGMNQEGAA